VSDDSCFGKSDFGQNFIGWLGSEATTGHHRPVAITFRFTDESTLMACLSVKTPSLLPIAHASKMICQGSLLQGLSVFAD
jgi:hypothetical protein